ncbi:Zfrp8 [Drosophila busckii]|uniref:Zfrp8 n=1 Tax=Drosophila busckii TaxID=30019 RepID=A0A0M3QUF6_DROBS|nr:programmed cell death protein 2 [Drosophila busckii]ALC40549.1 Zfrp8 [Drosophila busckii]
MDVDLGFADKPEDAGWLVNRYFPSKLGGLPAWLELKELPTTTQLQCKKCQAQKAFLCQLYADYEDDFNFHRTVYVFMCRNADCQQANRADNFTVLRSQLPRSNKFYSEEEPSDDVLLPAIESPRKLCAACGCLAPHSCSRCKIISYCCAAHQRAHWPQHKPDCGTTKVSTTCRPLPDLVFAEYEINMEHNLEEDDTHEKDEQARMSEFIALSEAGKTGELSDVPENELEKYFDGASSQEDKVFQQFKKQTAAKPDQIVRYERGGQPLWIANTKDTIEAQLQAIPNCSKCDGPRQFEFQIMPQVLSLLGDSVLDWGVLAVYTCARSCRIEGYVEEYLVKQDIVA